MDGDVEMPEIGCDSMMLGDKHGNWEGHILPGTLFLVWGFHWMVSSFYRYAQSMQKNGAPYRSRSTEPIFPFWSWTAKFNKYPMEAILKVVICFFLFFLQINYQTYKNIICTSDEKRAGHIDTSHVASWAHASMNLGYMVSGMVEIVGYYYDLPAGLEQVVLSLGIFIEGFLFLFHKKHWPVDVTIHALLGYVIVAECTFTALEAFQPHNFIFTFGRIATHLFQGTWFYQSARVLFDGLVFWTETPDGEMGPSMFLPIIFTYHLLLLVVVMVAILVGFMIVYGNVKTKSPHVREMESFGLLDTEDHDGTAEKAIMMNNLHGRKY